MDNKNTKKEYIFLGAPASGKGTQTNILAEELNLPHIDTGSLLRAAIKAQTPEGILAQGFIDKGQLVPIDVVAQIIKNRLMQDDAKKGFILDGYPRSLEQADKLKEMLEEIDAGIESEFAAIYFDIDESILLDRIVNRWSCPNCGAIFNTKFKPSKKGDVCDLCDTKLAHRKDDTEEVAKARFETFYRETAPLMEYYEKMGTLRKLDATGSIDEIYGKLKKLLNYD